MTFAQNQATRYVHLYNSQLHRASPFKKWIYYSLSIKSFDFTNIAFLTLDNLMIISYMARRAIIEQLAACLCYEKGTALKILQ